MPTIRELAAGPERSWVFRRGIARSGLWRRTGIGGEGNAQPSIMTPRHCAGGFQFWSSVMGEEASSTTVLIRKRPSRATS